jgi:hypothetical protein
MESCGNCVLLLIWNRNVKRMSFEDVQLHIEWRTPVAVAGKAGRRVEAYFSGGFAELQVLR